MNSNFRSGFLMFGASLVMGCSSAPQNIGNDGFSADFYIDGIPLGSVRTQPSFTVMGGIPAALYMNKDGQIVYRSKGLDARVVDDNAQSKEAAGHLQLHAANETVNALWWTGGGAGKALNFATKNKDKQNFTGQQKINVGHGVLTRFTGFGAPGNDFGACYQDERNPGYQLYCNSVAAGASKWNENDVRLDPVPTGSVPTNVQEPQVVGQGEFWVALWTENSITRKDAKPYKVYASLSTDSGRNWQLPKILLESGQYLSSLKAGWNSGRFVAAIEEYQIGLKVVVVDVPSFTTRELVLEDTSKGGARISGIDLALTKEWGHFVWIEGGLSPKPRVKYARLGLQNEAPAPTFAYVESASSNTKQINPVVQADEGGRVVVAWQDYKDIRSNVYFKTSNDKGENWGQPKPVVTPGKNHAALPRLKIDSGAYYLGYDIYDDDKTASGTFVVSALDQGEFPRQRGDSKWVNKPATEVEKREKLEAALQRFRELRVKGDYSSLYDMYDFAYRSVSKKSQYVDSAGSVTYMDYVFNNIDIAGNIAVVDMDVTFRIDNVMVPLATKPYSQAPRTDKLKATWVWVYDAWYLEYATITGTKFLEF